MTTQGGPYLAFAAGCGWGEAAELYCRHEPPHPGAGQAPELHCRHEPPHPSAGRVVSETRFVTTRPWLRPLRSLAGRPERMPANWNIEMCNQSLTCNISLHLSLQVTGGSFKIRKHAISSKTPMRPAKKLTFVPWYPIVGWNEFNW